MLPDEHRLHVVLQGISRGFSAMNIASSCSGQPGSATSSSSAASPAATFLEASVRAGLNILVADTGAAREEIWHRFGGLLGRHGPDAVGGTQAGNTTNRRDTLWLENRLPPTRMTE